MVGDVVASRVKSKSKSKSESKSKSTSKSKSKSKSTSKSTASDRSVRPTSDGNGPLADGMGFTAIEALGHGELGCTLRAGAVSLESVEWLPTLAALPEFADRR